MTELATSKYDLELIIDKEGTEGLTKIYSSLGEEFAETPVNKLGFLEKDFVSDYFDAKTSESLNYLGLTSLFEREVSGYDEDVKTRFRRKEDLSDDLDRAEEVFRDTLDYYSTSGEISKTQKKAMMHLQVLDHYLDVLTFKHSLDLACAKGNAKKVQEIRIEKVIEDYSSVLKTYVENKKFIKRWKDDVLRIFNKSLNNTTSDGLEEILSSYQICDEKYLKRFQSLKDKILENKENSFLSMFEDGKRYGLFYVKNGIFGIGSLPFLFGGLVAYIGCVAVAIKEGAFFSNYLVGGVLGGATYLTYQYYKGLVSILNNINSKVNQKLIDKNEKLKEAIIRRKKSFSEPLP